jgi:hypothetical protein
LKQLLAVNDGYLINRKFYTDQAGQAVGGDKRKNKNKGK